VRELVDEHRRHIDRAAEESHVGAFHRPGLDEAVTEAQHDPVVVSGVLIFDPGKVLIGNRAPGRFHQRGMKRELALARLLYRMQLRAQVVGAQEVIGDPQLAGRVAL
jgi:hypothetical protein